MPRKHFKNLQKKFDRGLPDEPDATDWQKPWVEKIVADPRGQGATEVKPGAGEEIVEMVGATDNWRQFVY